MVIHIAAHTVLRESAKWSENNDDRVFVVSTDVQKLFANVRTSGFEAVSRFFPRLSCTDTWLSISKPKNQQNRWNKSDHFSKQSVNFFRDPGMFTL